MKIYTMTRDYPEAENQPTKLSVPECDVEVLKARGWVVSGEEKTSKKDAEPKDAEPKDAEPKDAEPKDSEPKQEAKTEEKKEADEPKQETVRGHRRSH